MEKICKNISIQYVVSKTIWISAFEIKIAYEINGDGNLINIKDRFKKS